MSKRANESDGHMVTFNIPKAELIVVPVNRVSFSSKSQLQLNKRHVVHHSAGEERRIVMDIFGRSISATMAQ